MLSRSAGWMLLAATAGLRLGVSAAEAALTATDQPEGPLLDLGITALAPYADKGVFVACSRTEEVLQIDLRNQQIVLRVKTTPAPSGLAVSSDASTLFVTCAGPESRVCLLDLPSGRALGEVKVGHTANSPVLSPDGRTLYVCNQFSDTVSIIDVEARREVGRVPVERQPVGAALSKDGRHLYVANHLHANRAGVAVVRASVSVIDTSTRRVIRIIALPNGSTLLRNVAVSPDGRYVAVAHNLARFHMPTTTVVHGWMNNAALSLIDTEELKLLNTVLLDNVELGAATPWAVQWTADGKRLLVTHAGTHELSILDWPGLLRKLQSLPETDPDPQPGYFNRAKTISDVPNDLRFTQGLRKRLPLKGNGPRALALAGDFAVVGDYFSNGIELVDLKSAVGSSILVRLGASELSQVRQGERYFNDARLCQEQWQSCASCHSSDGRVDGLNWDLQNDGIGNPKNVKSLLLSFATPPVMSMGVRADAAAAIRAGIRYILFTNQPPEVAAALDACVSQLKPVPSPLLVGGQMSAAALRGKGLFEQAKVGCAGCHRGPLLTDCKPHDVGTGIFDEASDQFYTPTLIELWRTAPYLHDGSAATIKEAITHHNQRNLRGRTDHLTEPELEDLLVYLKSL